MGEKEGRHFFSLIFGPINKIGARENIKIKPAAQAQWLLLPQPFHFIDGYVSYNKAHNGDPAAPGD